MDFCNATNYVTDIVVLAHVTSPFVSAETIRKCVDSVKSGKYDSAFTASKEQEFFRKKDRSLNFDPVNISRSQDLPIIYRETCGCYVFTGRLFLKNGRRVVLHRFICEVDKIEEIDINYIDDFQIADAVYMQNVNFKSQGGGLTL